jgi:hypothetical protein
LQECSNPNPNPSPSPNPNPNPNPDPDSNQGGTQGAGASTKLSNFIKAMQPAGRSGAQQKYSGVSVSVLPPAPTAAGVRHGAADMLCQSMPAELAVHTTGHDLTGISALWEYLNARISLCIPGSVILAGWPAFAYGQTGQGPVRAAPPPTPARGVLEAARKRLHTIAPTPAHGVLEAARKGLHTIAPTPARGVLEAAPPPPLPPSA